MEFICRPSISVEGYHRLSTHFRLFPLPEVPLSRCWPSSEMPGILCFKIVDIPIIKHALRNSLIIYILSCHWPILATRRPMPAQYLAIFGRKNDNARSNPGSSFIFLMTSHTIFVVFYYYITFFILLYEHIRISLSSIYSIINSCHITYLHC